jgi:hypothetical protein
MSEEAGNDDDDYRSLAAGYLSRARGLLTDLEHQKRKLRFRASVLSVLPPVVLKPIADALPNMDQTQKLWLYVGSRRRTRSAGSPTTRETYRSPTSSS